MRVARHIGAMPLYRPNTRRRMNRVLRLRAFGLGVIAPDETFLLAVNPPSFQTAMGKYWPATKAFMDEALRTGRLPAYTEEACSGVAPLDKKLLVTNLSANVLQAVAGGAGAAGAAGSAGAAAGAAAGGGGGSAGAAGALAAAAPFLIIGAVALGVIGAIFAHHAAAVKKEQTTMCAAVPGANEGLDWITGEFRGGRLSKQDAKAALDSLYSNFNAYVQPVLKDSGDGSKCNLACGYRRALQAVIAKKKAEIDDAPVGAFGILSGEGNLLPLALAAGLAWMVLS